MRYRYTIDDSPLRVCPECNTSLEREGGVDIFLSVAGHVVEVPSVLEEGWLQDTEDQALAKGFHSSTECAFCGGTLIDMEDVFEEAHGE